jgi:hypothetical protein
MFPSFFPVSRSHWSKNMREQHFGLAHLASAQPIPSATRRLNEAASVSVRVSIGTMRSSALAATRYHAHRYGFTGGRASVGRPYTVFPSFSSPICPPLYIPPACLLIFLVAYVPPCLPPYISMYMQTHLHTRACKHT